MNAIDYIKKFAKEMELKVEITDPFRQLLVIKKGNKEVLAFTIREVIIADMSEHPRNFIEPQFKALEYKLKEEIQSSR